MSAHIKPDSVDSYLSGICNQLEDHFPDVRKNCNSRLVLKTLAGCKRFHGTAVQRKQPLTAHYPTVVVDWLCDRVARGIATHDDFLFVSQFLTGFYTLLHLSERTYPDRKSLRNPLKVAQRESVTRLEATYGFFPPSHKADTFFEGNMLIIEKLDGPTDPHKPFGDYLASRNRLFPYHPQLWLRTDGSVPNRSWFIRQLRKLFPSESAIAGQSMRAGSATRLAESGALLYIIQAAGCWASSTFRIYIRKNRILFQSMIHGRPAFSNPAPARGH